MKVLTRVPRRLPGKPVLVREARGEYAIWTGRSWFGSVSSIPGRRGWHVTTPGSPPEVTLTFNGAKEEALHRAVRAEGG